MNPVFRPILVFGAWALWLVPFFLFRPAKEKAVQVGTSARWGAELRA
jgi:hypothetical protein